VENYAFGPSKNQQKKPVENRKTPASKSSVPRPVAPARAVVLEMSPNGATPLKRRTGALARFLWLLSVLLQAWQERGVSAVLCRWLNAAACLPC